MGRPCVCGAVRWLDLNGVPPPPPPSQLFPPVLQRLSRAIVRSRTRSTATAVLVVVLVFITAFINMVWGGDGGKGEIWAWGGGVRGVPSPRCPPFSPITPQFSCSRVPLRDCAARALNVSPAAVGPCELRALNISLGAPPGLCRPQGGDCDFPEVSGDGGGPESGVGGGWGGPRAAGILWVLPWALRRCGVPVSVGCCHGSQRGRCPHGCCHGVPKGAGFL